MNSREQGDWGELSAMSWLVSRGAKIGLPVGHSPDWDLVADLDGRMLRVQVKTTRVFRNGRWDTTLCTRGGNRSWSGIVKHLDCSRCDYVFVHVGDGRRWFIPAASIGGGTHIVVWGSEIRRVRG